MSTRNLRLSPALEEAVAQARAELEAAGELRPPTVGPYGPPLSDAARDAIAAFIEDGTYRRLADAIAVEDPELADL